MGGNGETTLAANSHASDTDIPTLDHLALSELERERRTLLVGCIRSSAFWFLFSYHVGGVLLTVKDLAVLKLANVTHADLVAALGNAAGTSLAVVNGHALDNLDTSSGLLSLLGLLSNLLLLSNSRRAGGAKLEVLGELHLLLRLGGLLLGLLLLGLLLAQLGLGILALLGNQLVETLSGLLSSALVLALLGLHQLGGLLLVSVDLLDAAGSVNVIELVLRLVANKLVELRGEVVVILIVVILVVRALGGIILVDDVVAGNVDGVGA